jgi:hypothetical protein
MPSILHLIAAASPAPAAFGGDLGPIQPVSTAYSAGSATGTGALTNMELLISNGLGLLTIIGGIFFLMQCGLGALEWIQSENDKGKKEKAQNHFTGGAVGIIIMVGFYSATAWLGPILGLDLLHPATTFSNIILKTTPAASPTP